MIALKGLTFAYRRQPKLFDSLDLLQLEPGQIYGLLGRNGAGKTTLLRILSGLLFPQSGQVEIMGFEPRHRQQAFLAEVFFLTEDHYLPALRIDQLVRRYAPFYPKFDEPYFKDVIQEFGLTSSQYVQDLSHGERKKIGLAFGLATGCRLMLMDEPTNGLDIPAKKQFRKLIAGAVGPERTFLISSHQVRDLQELIDPIIILDQGKVLLQADLETIGRKVAFQLQFREPAAGETFYYERVPGGYLCVKPGAEDADSSEIDLEILFNAIIQQPESFRKLFQKTLKHENQ